MYTELKNYQLIIAMLKKYGVKHLVLSAGSRNVPFVHSVEQDSYFKCYSVVDERSAGYFAIGLAQELNEPVLISCTASTASCNYYPPVAEAFYQNVPLIILTSDRDPQMLGQREDQMINQVDMFKRHTRKSVNLPIIHNSDDEYYCERLLNEALLELNHKGQMGPVHINVPMNSYNKSFIVNKLPEVKKIDRICYEDNDVIWKTKYEQLKNTNKIMIMCGQKNKVSKRLNDAIAKFEEKFNCIVAFDYMSNVNVDGFNTVMLMDNNYIDIPTFNNLLPEIIISFGGQVFSGLKSGMRNTTKKFEHWLIAEDGMVCDLFKGLKDIFECSPEFFFEKMCSFADSNMINNKEYHDLYEKAIDNIVIPELNYSGAYAIKKVVEAIPENSILHLSINDSIRLTNFFKLNKNISVYANIGTYGIDGCMSTFFGQIVANKNKQGYLIIGDLSYFYDMNSMKINSIADNAHILLINNHGGSEFYYNKTWVDEKSDLHTTARHNTKAEGWVKENNFIYLSAHNKTEFDEIYKKFINSKKKVLFEVFTEMKSDADEIYNIYNYSKKHDIKTDVMRTTKDFVKKHIGQEKAKRILDRIKK